MLKTGVAVLVNVTSQPSTLTAPVLNFRGRFEGNLQACSKGNRSEGHFQKNFIPPLQTALELPPRTGPSDAPLHALRWHYYIFQCDPSHRPTKCGQICRLHACE